MERYIFAVIKNPNNSFHSLGYSSSENTWEPENHLVNCQEMVRAFRAEQANKNQSEDSDSSQDRTSYRSTRSSVRQAKRQFSTDSSSMNDDSDSISLRSSSKRLRQDTIDSDTTSSTYSYDSGILDVAKLDQILDVRRNKDRYQVEYNIRLRKVKKSVWISSNRLTENYAQQVIDFLEEEYV